MGTVRSSSAGRGDSGGKGWQIWHPSGRIRLSWYQICAEKGAAGLRRPRASGATCVRKRLGSATPDPSRRGEAGGGGREAGGRCGCGHGGRLGVDEEEAATGGGAEEPDVLLLEHFPGSKTLVEASNESGDGGELQVVPVCRKDGWEEADDEDDVAAAEAAARVV